MREKSVETRQVVIVVCLFLSFRVWGVWRRFFFFFFFFLLQLRRRRRLRRRQKKDRGNRLYCSSSSASWVTWSLLVDRVTRKTQGGGGISVSPIHSTFLLNHTKGSSSSSSSSSISWLLVRDLFRVWCLLVVRVCVYAPLTSLTIFGQAEDASRREVQEEPATPFLPAQIFFWRKKKKGGRPLSWPIPSLLLLFLCFKTNIQVS